MMTRVTARRAAAGIAMAVAMVVGSTGFAGTAYADIVYFPSHYTYYQVKNGFTGKCLEVYGIAQHDGADVVQWDCWNGPNQHWILIPTDGIWHEIRNRHSNKCLEVYDHAYWPGADVVQWTCWGGWNQQWAVYSPAGSQWLHLIPRNAMANGVGSCAGVPYLNIDNGADVVLESCDANTSRMWGFFTIP